jgi:hypothetical protein
MGLSRKREKIINPNGRACYAYPAGRPFPLAGQR